MSFVKNAFYSATRLIPLSVLQQNNQLLLPYQHLVSTQILPYVSNLYPYKATQQFTRDVEYLATHFTPVTLQDVINAKKNGQALPKRAFLFSFDDGFKEVAEIIAPILHRKGIPAVFFLNNAFLDNKEMFYRFMISMMAERLKQRKLSNAELEQVAHILGENALDNANVSTAIRKITYRSRYLVNEVGAVMGVSPEDIRGYRPFMTLDEVTTLVKQGFAIGGHSIDHPYYKELTLEEQLHQTLTSVNFLTARFNLDYRVFAFPHTDEGVSRKFFETLLQGPDQLDLIFGTANHKQDISSRILHRFNCERPNIDIESAVKGILLYNKLQQLRNTNIIYRK